MKKFYLFALAAGLLFGACSTESVEVAEPETGYGLIAGESSWLAVGIAMPGDPATRANEDLDDGLATEYDVKAGTLYLFKGANEDDAKFFQSFEINTTFSNETTDLPVPEGSTNIGNITSTSQKIVQEIENPDLGITDKLYAYVILNDGNATGITATVDQTTGAQFKQQQLKAIGIADETKGYGAMGTKGLVMTSVPIATVAGGETTPADAEIITFTEIDKSAIFKTKEEAEAAPAAVCIYVERAAAKVEVIVADDFEMQLDGDGTPTGVAAEDVKWALGNVNVAYYNTRQIDKTWLPYNNLEANPVLKYRMVGRTPFFADTHTPNPAYRTYFGKDINFDGKTGLIKAELEDADYTLASKAVVYTYENTFDENSQIWANTTYVGVKAKISDGDFYTIQGQPNTMLKNNADIVAVVKTRLRDVINQAIAAINAKIKAADPTEYPVFPAGSEVTYDVTVTVTEGTFNTETGELPYTVTLGLANVKVGGAEVDGAQAALETLAADNIGVVDNPANSKVYKYVGGNSYYATRIQHFGDNETPWNGPAEAYNHYDLVYPTNATQTIDGTTIKYGADRASAWLGRWGVVRNNWYVLTLKKITGIGSPVPEDFSGNETPDDNPPTSYFITAEVHILPWVKRTQDVEF